MKRVLGFSAFLAVLVGATLAISTPAHAIEWNEIHPFWTTGLDTTFVTDESDSDFVVINTADWDWPAANPASGILPYVQAFVTFTAQTSNAAGDSIYYVVQRGVPTYTAAGIPITIWENWPAGPTSAAGNVAVVDQGFGGTSNVRYSGVLLADADALPTAINCYGAGLIRLRVQGDQGGTTPKLSGVRCFIRYPKRLY
jgi:hypothetical protein